MPRLRHRIILIPLIAILWAALSFGAYSAWVHGADHRDFYPRWAGARLSLFSHQDLYSPETTRQMQVMLYGHALPPGVDQQGFAYPAQLLVVLLPFWFINNLEVATAAWEGLSILLLLASLVALNGVRARPLPGWVILAFLVWQYPLLMVFQGQVTILPLLGLVLGLRFYCRGQDLLAGTALTLGIVKPELSLLPWLVLIYLALSEKRWKLVAAFLTAQAALFLASVILAGWWVPGWVEAVVRYAGYAKPVWAPLAAWRASPLLAGVLLAWTLAAILLLRRGTVTWFSASIPLGLLVLPQTLVWGLTMLLAPLSLSWQGKAHWLVGAAWLLGWGFLFLPGSAWQVQSVLMPAFTLGIVTYASRG